jgi:hypothetical protein
MLERLVMTACLDIGDPFLEHSEGLDMTLPKEFILPAQGRVVR